MAAVVNSFIALPKATKYLTVALVSFSLIAGIRHYTTASVLDDGTGSNAPLVAWLNLVPGQFLWSPWTLATATFVESNILALALSTFSLTMAGRWLERQWGSKEFLKFFAVVTIGSNVVCLFVFMLFYGITGDVGTFLYTRINGMNALHEAMLVALMQMIPEHRVQFLAGKVSFRVKHLPMVFVTISQIILFLTPSAPMFLIQFGWLIGWVYLRFFKVTDGIKGDRSETFAFANFFPPFLQGPISKVSTIIFDALVSFGICSARGYDAVNTYGGTVPLPVHSRAEAERRRCVEKE